MKTKRFKTVLFAAVMLSLIAPALNRWNSAAVPPAAIADVTFGPKPGTTGFAPGLTAVFWC